MIADRTMEPGMVLDFLVSVSDDLPLGEALSGLGISLEEYAKKLAEKGTIAYETENGKVVCGIIGYTHDTPDQGSYITQVATVKSCRQRGIAQKLFEEYFTYAKNVGIRYIWLTTGIENISAQHLYEKCGFQKVAVVENKLIRKKQYRYEYHF